MFISKLFEQQSSTYTYLLADLATKEAVIIDPVIDTVERDAKLIQQLGLKLVYAGNKKTIFPRNLSIRMLFLTISEYTCSC